MIKKLITASLLLGFFSTSVFSQSSIKANDDEFCAESVRYGVNDVYNIYDNDLGSGYWFNGGTVNSTTLGDGWFEGGGVRLFVKNPGAGPFVVRGSYCISNGTESCANTQMTGLIHLTHVKFGSLRDKAIYKGLS